MCALRTNKQTKVQQKNVFSPKVAEFVHTLQKTDQKRSTNILFYFSYAKYEIAYEKYEITNAKNEIAYERYEIAYKIAYEK